MDSVFVKRDMYRRTFHFGAPFMRCGIYEIRNKLTGKFYIGSSNHIYRRWSYHRNRLKNNKHPNMHLQSSWNKHGPDAFDWVIVLDCELDRLRIEEQLLLTKQWASGNCYNFSQYVHPFTAHQHSDAHKEKMRMRFLGENNPQFGIEKDPNAIELVNRQLSARCTWKKLSDNQVRMIRSRYAGGGIGAGKLAKEYGVTKKTIQKIIKGERYRYVEN